MSNKGSLLYIRATLLHIKGSVLLDGKEYTNNESDQVGDR